MGSSSSPIPRGVHGEDECRDFCCDGGGSKEEGKKPTGMSVVEAKRSSDEEVLFLRGEEAGEDRGEAEGRVDEREEDGDAVNVVLLLFWMCLTRGQGGDGDDMESAGRKK